ncbi:MAG: YggS family pyridoxal phosphate-dependent enzyme [Oligoflexia bacterium]|nr:YggS family pyridoxal phosphate-dependent enzyme [Oligoflexia bacterium]
MTSPSSLGDAYRAILERIAAAEKAAGRHPGSTCLIAVSKTQPADRIEELYALGHRDFGENYVQELLEKADILAARGCDEIRWHFIGHLQSKKVKSLLPHVYCVHSVDSEKLLGEIARRQGEREGGTRMPIFIEINIGDEASKSGISKSAARPLTERSADFPDVELLGLMCVPEANLSEDQITARFAELRELEKECRPFTRGQLSMGMSHDFELAIVQGATHIRVGTALFGARK